MFGPVVVQRYTVALGLSSCKHVNTKQLLITMSSLCVFSIMSRQLSMTERMFYPKNIRIRYMPLARIIMLHPVMFWSLKYIFFFINLTLTLWHCIKSQSDVLINYVNPFCMHLLQPQTGHIHVLILLTYISVVSVHNGRTTEMLQHHSTHCNASCE